MQLHELPPEDLYGLSTSTFKKQTAQKLICNNLRKSTLSRLLERLKQESDQAGPRSVEQIRYRNFLSNNNETSGLWLRPYMMSKDHRLSNEEFKAALCRRNTIENPSIPKSNPQRGEHANNAFRCTCKRNALKDPFGYHWPACTVGRFATWLHDDVVHLLVILLRSIGLVVILEPLHLFENLQADDNRRPDICINNPYGGGPQIILDVAVTGVNGQSRRSDQDADQPLQYRYNQKMSKYAQVAQQNGFVFIPAIFSHTGQIHKAVMDLMYSQIKHKLELDDPEVKSSKIQGMLNLWVKKLSCVINRTACRTIVAGTAALVDAVNSSSRDDSTSTQRDDQQAANSIMARNFIEDLELSLINHEHKQH